MISQTEAPVETENVENTMVPTDAPATAEITPVPTAEPTATPTATPAPTATPTPSPTATPKPTAAPTATSKPTATPVALDLDGMFDYYKEFVVANGNLNGDYVSYYKTADYYGGDSGKNFIVYYWGDTDTIEICLHEPINDTYSVANYFYIPKTYTGTYKYTTDYYYRSDGVNKYSATGVISAATFTHSYPLTCSRYTGDTNFQNTFMEEYARKGICELLDSLKNFITKENIKYSFTDMGFTKF